MLSIDDAILSRHSVRQYHDIPLPKTIVALLQARIKELNNRSGLHMQLVVNDPHTFDTTFAHYGKFENVRNYIALVGEKGSDLDEKCGYYGEQLVLYAQQLGLNTCWVGLRVYKKPQKVQISSHEKMALLIIIGYRDSQGVPHRSRPFKEVADVKGPIPRCFLKGMKYTLVAPTALNQQKFKFSLLDNGTVEAKAGLGFYTKVDLGIVKYHFEIGAGRHQGLWA